MFNLRNLTTTLRFCVVAVFLLVPPTSAAAPANDDHFALRGEAAARGGDWQRRGATADETTCSFNIVAPHSGDCIPDCEKRFDGCVVLCQSTGSGRGCVIGCALAHGWCIYNCTAAP